METAAESAPEQAHSRYLQDPEIFLSIEDLDLVGRGLADAVWHGQHQSRLRGDGVEFHSHRAYQAGDDLRRVNWALFARQRKLYTKESRQESRRPVYVLVDSSASMSVQHGRYTKLDYANRLAAGICHLARRQGDAPALGILGAEGLRLSLPARSSADHLSGLCAALANARAVGGGNLADSLPETQPLCRKRGFIFLLADFFEQEDRILHELATYRAQGHDVAAIQVLDPMEIALPKTGDYDFLDPETGSRIRTSTEPIHAAYAKKVAAWREGLQRQAEAAGLHWTSASTEDSLIHVLRGLLGAT